MQTIKRLIILIGLITGGCASGPELTGGEIARREVVTETPCEGGVCRVTERDLRASAPRTRGASAESADLGGIELTPAGGVIIGASGITGMISAVPSETLLWIGAGVMVVGVAVGWISGSVVLGVLLGLTGAGLLGIHYQPWIAGAAAGVSLLGALLYGLWRLRAGSLAERSERQTRAGLEVVKRAAPDIWRGTIKPSLRAAQDEAIQRRIKA